MPLLLYLSLLSPSVHHPITNITYLADRIITPFLTQANLYQLPWQLQASRYWNPHFERLWIVDCLARSTYLADLMLDAPSDDPMIMRVKMTLAQDGDAPALGDDITQLAEKLLHI